MRCRLVAVPIARLNNSYQLFTEAAVSEWTPKVGTSAAQHRAKFDYLRVRVVPPVGIPTALIAWAGIDTGNPLVIAFIAVLGAFLVTVMVAMCWHTFAYLRAASRSLGMKIGLTGDPPRDTQRYLAWCSARGLKPFSAPRT
jgi:hypothetical protein